MSGRKDYEYNLEPERLARLAREIRARRDERAQQTRQRLERAKDEARRRAAEIGQQQRASNQQRMREAAERSERAVETAKLAAQRATEQTEAARAAEALRRVDQAQRQREIEQQEQAETEAASETELRQEIEQQLQIVLQWRESFSENENVQTFTADELRVWQETTQQTIDQMAQTRPTKDALAQLQQAVAGAERIDERAGERLDQFYARNLVMQDIIASLKEIGFFVQNPEFVEPEHPEGAVIIRANRGNQKMVTKIALDQSVESDWQGIHGEYCTDGFFEYVKAMDGRGVKIAPNDPALKPRMLQKGAKGLPGGRQQSMGGNG